MTCCLQSAYSRQALPIVLFSSLSLAARYKTLLAPYSFGNTCAFIGGVRRSSYSWCELLEPWLLSQG
jgi:hypothetical protein